MDTEKNNRFKMIRTELGISQSEMAKALVNAKNTIKEWDAESEARKKKTGITKTYISYLENGKRTLTPAVSELMRRAFCVNEQWLETGEGSMFLDIQPENEIVVRVTSLLEKTFNLLESFKELEKVTELYASEKAENVIIRDNKRIKEVIKLSLAQRKGVLTLAEVYKCAVALAETGMMLCDTLIEEKKNMPLLQIDADRIEQMYSQFVRCRVKYSSEHINVERSSPIDLSKIRDKLISEDGDAKK